MRKMGGTEALGLDVTDVGQVAVLAVVVQAVTHEEEITTVQGAEVGLVSDIAAAFLVDSHGGGHSCGTCGEELIAYSFHGGFLSLHSALFPAQVVVNSAKSALNLHN